MEFDDTVARVHPIIYIIMMWWWNDSMIMILWWYFDDIVMMLWWYYDDINLARVCVGILFEYVHSIICFELKMTLMMTMCLSKKMVAIRWFNGVHVWAYILFWRCPLDNLYIAAQQVHVQHKMLKQILCSLFSIMNSQS